MGSSSSKVVVTESIKAFVDSTINSHKVVVFSGSYCPYCTKAKKALANYKINDIKIIELDKEYKSDFNSVMNYLGQLTGAETVPRVFIDKKFIGGGDDTQAKFKSGELKTLLENCNAITQ